MMLLRMMENSVFQAIADLFRDPPLATNQSPSLSRPWNVYLEKDLRRGLSSWPYVYLIDAEASYLSLRPPGIIIDFSSLAQHFSYQFGTQSFGKILNLTMHCIGRDRGMSKDLGSYISENLRSMVIYDYNNPLTPGSYPVVDTRPRLSQGSLPERYFPSLNILQIDPAISEGTFKAPMNQKQQGLLTSSHMVAMKFLASQ